MLSVSQLVYLELPPINLELAAGSSISIQGKSGCGKSRMLRAIADLDPHQGLITLDGSNYLNWSGPEWRRQVALHNAEQYLWHDTVREHFNVYEVSTVSALIKDFLLPETILSRNTAELSSGEQQRLALLLVLLNNPKVLLLDESTSHLDETTTLKIEDRVNQYLQHQNAAAIWISHDARQRQRVAKQHYLLENGQLKQLN